MFAVHPRPGDGVHTERREAERDEEHCDLTQLWARRRFTALDALGLVRVVLDRGMSTSSRTILTTRMVNL